jgi:glycerophosphoryl diester phosphodiesterase
MRALLAGVFALMTVAATPLPPSPPPPQPPAPPIIIAHRGASADRPEHTLAAYALAIEQGADFIEPDLVSTKDNQLVARHENEISGTTNVADHPEFASRRTTKTIDGQTMTGWFTEDFTLAELKTLRARERLPQLRPANTKYDEQESIPTLDEIIALAKSGSVKTGRTIGIYPETKHPSYFRSINLPLEPPLLAALAKAGWTTASAPVFIQSFEAGNLKALKTQTGVRLIQLIDSGTSADGVSYDSMTTPAGLTAIAAYAAGIGPSRDRIIPRDAAGTLLPATPLVRDAHAARLQVHPWTARPENYFLAAPFKKGANPVDRGDAAGEIRAYLETGIDGIFSDSTAAAVEAMSPAK